MRIWNRRRTKATHVPLFLATALLIAVVPAAANAIDVELAEKMFLQSRGFVSVACGGLSSTGCLVLTDFRIDCRCSLEGSQWRIRWTIRGKTAAFVTTPQSARHEAQHVKDLRARLESFAAQLENARFDKSADCERAVDRAIEVFPDAVRDVLRKDVLQIDHKPLEPSQILPAHR